MRSVLTIAIVLLLQPSSTMAETVPVLKKNELREVREAGLAVFATPFTKADGFGDGFKAAPGLEFGNRPTMGDGLRGNGTNLRFNGLDAQTCLECHSIVSNATVPATFGVGGSGSTATLAMFHPDRINPETGLFTGRFIDPPALFGTGGVELLGQEMTSDLQALRRKALAEPGANIRLLTKGVDFGTILAGPNGSLDTSRVEGVDDDLVIRPFGRKGEFATVQGFDLGALQFHMGIQAVEEVGVDVDADGDGVVNEASFEDLRHLHVFVTTQPRPRRSAATPDSRAGLQHFQDIGCADCHRPAMRTRHATLAYTSPGVAAFAVDLSQAPAGFRRNKRDGLRVPLFSDLKRHDMGDDLAENFHLATDQQNREFITAKLWGVADSAPYLHDGRAHTLEEAIDLHGGEATAARDAFVSALTSAEQQQLIDFLKTLSAPRSPNADVIKPRR